MNHDAKEKIIEYINELKDFYEKERCKNSKNDEYEIGHSDGSINTLKELRKFIEEVYK